MKGHLEVIENLKEILTNELTAVNQYFLHSSMCKDWGYTKLSTKMYKESIDEMKHAKTLIDRILFLQGAPNVQKLHNLNIGTNVKKQLENDLQLEMKAIDDLKKSIALCMKLADYTSRELLEKILISEEEHADWIESQLHIIKEVGEENYLSQQISS